MFCSIPEKTKHEPVLIDAIRCCCNSKFSASLLTYTDSTRFWQIWYPNVSLILADYIYTRTNLNPVINAGSLESAKEDSKTYFASKRVQLLSRSSHRGRTNENSSFLQLLSNLRARRLVIPTHLLVHESSCFHRQLFRSPRAR